MHNPVIFIVEADPTIVQALERNLSTHYGDAFQLAHAASVLEAREQLRALKQQGQLVAIVLCEQDMPEGGGGALLAETRDIYPDAARVLLVPRANTVDATVKGGPLGVHHCLTTPWAAPEAQLYPMLDELLEDWRARVQLPYMQVKAIMDTRVARIRLSASLHYAAEIVALSGAADLMVVDDEGHFVGVLSEGDILRNALPDLDEIVEAGGTLYDAYQLFVRKGRELAHMPIAPLVIHEPLVVHPDDHVAKVATVLIARQIRRLPVVQDGKLVGTVSRANICQAVVGLLP